MEQITGGSPDLPDVTSLPDYVSSNNLQQNTVSNSRRLEMQDVRDRGRGAWEALSKLERHKTSRGTLAALVFFSLVILSLSVVQKTRGFIEDRRIGHFHNGHNMLLNPGFEGSDSSTGAAYWISVPQVRGNDATVVRDTEYSFTGESSLAISRWSTATISEVGAIQRLSEVPLSSRLVLSGRIRSRDAVAFLRLAFLDSTESVLISTHTTPKVEGKNDWREVRAAVEIPETAGAAYVSLVVKGKGTAWFDNVRLITDEVWKQKQMRLKPLVSEQFKNGGFEQTVSGILPAGWLSPATTRFTRGLLDPSKARSGKYSVRLESGADLEQPISWRQECLVPVFAGQALELKGYVRYGGCRWAGVSIKYLDTNLRTIAQRTAGAKDASKTGNSWSPASVATVTPPQAKYLIIEAMMVGPGRAWFDDVTLKPIRNPETIIR